MSALTAHLAVPTILQSFSSPQAINVAWALVTLGWPCAALLVQIADHLLVRGLGPTLHISQLGAFLWAVASSAVQHKALMAAVSAYLLQQDAMAQLHPSHLSLVVWAFARLGHCHAKLLDEIATRAVALNISSWRPSDLSELAWAFATLNRRHAPLFTALLPVVATREVLQQCSGTAAANLLWAVAVLGLQHQELTCRAAVWVASPLILSQLTQADLIRIAWALAVFDCHHDGAFAAILQRLTVLADVEADLDPDLDRLAYAFFLHVRLNAEALPSSMAILDRLRPLEAHCRMQFTIPHAPATQLSTEVAALLLAMAVPVQLNASLPDGAGHWASLFLPDSHLIIEPCVGSCCAWEGAECQEGGALQLKRRQLTRLGYTVLTIPEHHWASLPDAAERWTFLTQVLTAAT
eukprot:GGOE01000029.1.p1 GENE.GGOE01000029.1~~GGOE01000029.1.p1  ORF type:complete len:443 (+),score=104.03 GGOE01000029.1:103-1329(+)